MPEEPKTQPAPDQPEWPGEQPIDQPLETNEAAQSPEDTEPSLGADTSVSEETSTPVGTEPTTEPSLESEPAPGDQPAVATEEVAPVAEPVAAPLATKSKKPLLIGLIVAGALALLVGGSALAYNVWYQNPTKVVSDAIINAITAKTVAASGVIDVESEDYTMKIEASAKNSAQANSQMAVKLTLASEELELSVDGEGILSSSGDMYIKVNDAQQLADTITEQSGGMLDLEVFGDVITKIDGQWIKIGSEDLGTFSEDYAKTQQCVADISKQLDEDAAFVKTVEGEVKTLYTNNQFIIVEEKLGSKTVNGQGSLGYALSADSDKADAFFTGFAETELGQRLKECDESINFAEIITDELKENSDVKTTAELWVSRFGHEITEFRATTEDDGEKGVIVITPVFNKEQTVDIPATSIPLAELQADIQSAYEQYYVSNETMMTMDDTTLQSTTEFN